MVLVTAVGFCNTQRKFTQFVLLKYDLLFTEIVCDISIKVDLEGLGALFNYHPQTRLWEDNVFTGVCLSTGHRPPGTIPPMDCTPRAIPPRDHTPPTDT